eukprot:6201458-Prymnesium_polylepis.1
MVDPADEPAVGDGVSMSHHVASTENEKNRTQCRTKNEHHPPLDLWALNAAAFQVVLFVLIAQLARGPC